MFSKKRLRREGWREKQGRLWEDPYSERMYTYGAASNICASRKGMVPGNPIKFLIDAHYHLMDDKKFWYDPGAIDASRILCVSASNMRQEQRKKDIECGRTS